MPQNPETRPPRRAGKEKVPDGSASLVNTVEVEFEDARYRLVSINDVSTQAILRSARHRYGWFGDKRFREDLPQVLSGMGMEPRPTVSLVMRNMQGEEIRVDEAFLAAENRARVYLNEK